MDYGRVFMLLQIVELSRAHGPNTPIFKLKELAEAELAGMVAEEAGEPVEEEITYADNNPAPTEHPGEEGEEEEDADE